MKMIMMMMMTWTWLPVLCGASKCWLVRGGASAASAVGVLCVRSGVAKTTTIRLTGMPVGGRVRVRVRGFPEFADPQLHLHIWPGHLTIVNTLVACLDRQQLHLHPADFAVLGYIGVTGFPGMDNPRIPVKFQELLQEKNSLFPLVTLDTISSTSPNCSHLMCSFGSLWRQVRLTTILCFATFAFERWRELLCIRLGALYSGPAFNMSSASQPLKALTPPNRTEQKEPGLKSRAQPFDGTQVCYSSMWEQVNWPGADVLQSFWTHLRTELRFRTLLYYRLSSCDCWFEGFLGGDKSTNLLWNNEEYPHYLRYRQDMDVLAVACLRTMEYRKVLTALSMMLDQMRSVPVVLQLCEEEDPDPSKDLNSAGLIFQLSVELQMLNVLLLPWGFLRSSTFYAYEVFPRLKITKQLYDSHLTLFPYKLANLQGHPIRTSPDNSEPHTIVHRALNGTYMVSGPIWQFMKEFVRHLNGTLQLLGEPAPDRTLRYVQALDLVRNDTLDIAASLRPHIPVQRDNMHMFSYPLVVGDWCTMLPMERVLSTHEALIRLVTSPWTWLYLLLLYTVHSLVTRRAQLRHRLFHVVKPLTHLAVICFLQAQLSAFFIDPQQVNHITNMRQLEKSGLRIMGLRTEFQQYPIEMRSRYASSFLLQDVFSDVTKHRNKFNSSYGYTLTSVKWQLYDEAQKHFRRPLFRYSQDICVQKLSLFSLILRDNCLYRYQLKEFSLRLHEGGHLYNWYSRSFYVMVQAGRLHFEDLSTSHKVLPIRWSEWQYVMALYGAGLLVSLVVIVIELTLHYVNVCLQNL